MRFNLSWKFLAFLLLLLVQITVQARKQKTAVVSDIGDVKELKKLLRTKTNVLILFLNRARESHAITETFRSTADIMKGQATLVAIDCSNSNTKKLCKNQKIVTDKPYTIKHYRNGDFHKVYDRGETVSAMTNFLRDPTGDLPWEEDPNATDVFHLTDGEALNKFLKKSAVTFKKSLIMFYAPWCGYCKTLKPEYVQAAIDLKGQAFLAAIDVAKPGNSKIRQVYNITGFPTMLYYEKGQFKFTYNGENKKQSIVDFVKDPEKQMLQKKKQLDEETWSQDSDVVHLTEDNFDKTLSNIEHALVVFYAPWCTHCKRIKPQFEKAAARLKSEKINGLLGAVDVTKQPKLGARFEVTGYPTLKYFSKGQYKYDGSYARQENEIVDFIKEPKEPPPPPPPEQPWSEQESSVRHLDSSTFSKALRRVKHSIVMFYAPWCGHCKSTKPEFVNAAERFADELLVMFGAVDCTENKDLCAEYDVRGYPTFKYFSHLNKANADYTGGRKEADFVSYIHSHMNQPAQQKVKSNSEAGFGTNMQLVSDDNFGSIIGSQKPTIVMFYASWCGHCSTVKPAFSRLASTMKMEMNGAVQVIAIDAADNPKTADFANIETLPAFKMYMAGKQVAVFDKDRSYENFLSFCKSFLKVKEEL